MGIQTNGFKKFSGKLEKIEKEVARKSNIAVRRTAHIVRKNVIKKIGEQPSGWKALSPKYAKWKQARGGSNLLLISGIRTANSKGPITNYRNSFEVAKLKNGVYAVGSNYPQAAAMEFGYAPRNLPARPHFEPAIDDSREAILVEYGNLLKEVFGN